VQAAYGTEKFARLRALKDRYDPTNLSHLNQNIPPSKAG
jgi:FAD/FMN-containing dehydrogenase